MNSTLTENKEYIDPREIDKALSRVLEKQSGILSTRASLFNLIIYTKADYRKEYLSEIAKRIIRKFPCRLMLITEYDEPGQSFLKTSVSGVQPDSGDRSIFCDGIHFDVCGAHTKRLSSVILPHLLPDLPVYLIWGDSPSSNDPISLGIEDYLTRVIYDSETVPHMTRFAKKILSSKEALSCEIGDLNWARLKPWREAFAHMFQHEESLQSLQKAKSLSISYNDMTTEYYSHSKIQATYFQAWIAAKMGWKYVDLCCKGSSLTFTYEFENETIEVALTPEINENVSPSRLIRVLVEGTEGQTYSLKRTESDPNILEMQFSSNDRCDLPMHYLLSTESTVRSLSYEIYNRGTNSTLISVLELITNYQEGVICS